MVLFYRRPVTCEISRVRMRKRSFISISAVVVCLCYLALSFGWTTQGTANDPGVGWHLRNGAAIVQSGMVSRYDSFLALPRESFAGMGAGEARLWVADQWLSDVLWFEAHRFGGWSLVHAVCVGIFTITFWGIVAPTSRASSGAAVASIVATLLAWKASQMHFIARPVLVSFLFFAIVVWRARVIVAREEFSWSVVARDVALLAPLFVLWANAHPAFSLGLVVLGFGLLARSVSLAREVFVKRSSPRCTTFFPVVGVAVVCVVCACATLVTPWGVDLPRSIVELGTSEYLRSLNQEWQPFGWGNVTSGEGVPFLSLTVVSLVIALVCGGVRGRVGVYDFVLSCVFTCAAFRSVRLIPFASIVSVPVCVAALRAIGAARMPGVFALTTRVCGQVSRFESVRGGGARVAVALALGGIVWVACGGRFQASERLAPSERLYPSRMIEAMKQDASSGVVLASPDVGGFITFAGFPSFKPVLDDRNTLVGEELYRRYFRSLREIGALQELVRVFGVTYVVLPLDAPVIDELSRGQMWPILYQDDMRVVYKVSQSSP